MLFKTYVQQKDGRSIDKSLKNQGLTEALMQYTSGKDEQSNKKRFNKRQTDIINGSMDKNAIIVSNGRQSMNQSSTRYRTNNATSFIGSEKQLEAKKSANSRNQQSSIRNSFNNTMQLNIKSVNSNYRKGGQTSGGLMSGNSQVASTRNSNMAHLRNKTIGAASNRYKSSYNQS